MLRRIFIILLIASIVLVPIMAFAADEPTVADLQVRLDVV
ncbi:MAG: hypothetical protein JG777_431 [Clostridia bacterium]|jgi:hypothetical protein|nr:hypothetical protein [Clostridia bacterium]